MKIENPRFFRHDEKDLEKVQRLLSKAEKGTPEREDKLAYYWKGQKPNHHESAPNFSNKAGHASCVTG